MPVCLCGGGFVCVCVCVCECVCVCDFHRQLKKDI